MDAGSLDRFLLEGETMAIEAGERHIPWHGHVQRIDISWLLFWLLLLLLAGGCIDQPLQSPLTDRSRTAPCCPAQYTGTTTLSPLGAETASTLCSEVFPLFSELELPQRPSTAGRRCAFVYPLAPDDRIVLAPDDARALGTELARFYSTIDGFDMAFATTKRARSLRDQYDRFESQRSADVKEADYGLRLTSFETLNFGEQLVLLGAAGCDPTLYRVP